MKKYKIGLFINLIKILNRNPNLLSMDTKDKTKGVEEVKKNKVRITLTCRNLKNVERGIKYIRIIEIFEIY